jgi:conserved oligomeric Golgi complex subunit 1
VSSLDRLGLSRPTLVTKGVIEQVLRHFRSAVAQKLSVESVTWGQEVVQLLWDLTFLRQLSCTPSDVSGEAADALSQEISHLREQVSHAICHNNSIDHNINAQVQSAASEDVLLQLQVHIDHSIEKYLPRSQTLLSPLLTVSTHRKPHTNGNAEIATTTPKMNPTALLPLGAPKADQDFRPAIEIVKPSTRFGLLLVGSTTMPTMQ